ncbi:hypothetical protein EVAR_56297_1 [Eumeta japonica]|uniref:DNA helicase Pif1-like 2B domain-containing protein n=1 Tax=Eumeta variegata TaxID=151549 RepID=A0A4C1Z596_EUMVA|nr:hypothetical protein EVAR_56297_1 [Eumeta japonica]
MPPHELIEKVEALVILLRNLNSPKLCNGTRIMIESVEKPVTEVTILIGCAGGRGGAPLVCAAGRLRSNNLKDMTGAPREPGLRNNSSAAWEETKMKRGRCSGSGYSGTFIRPSRRVLLVVI